MSLAELHLTRQMVTDLDSEPVGQLQSVHRDFTIATTYAEGQGYWRRGDGPPAARLDPVTAQAAGRCVASRIRGTVSILDRRAIHPTTCCWCSTPINDLLVALDHATFVSRYVVSEYVVWPTRGEPYTRDSGRSGTYEHPDWAAFFALDRDDRRELIDAASRLVVAA